MMVMPAFDEAYQFYQHGDFFMSISEAIINEHHTNVCASEDQRCGTHLPCMVLRYTSHSVERWGGVKAPSQEYYKQTNFAIAPHQHA